jgi:hypothetical protein
LGREVCATDVFSFLFLGGNTCTLELSFGDIFWLSFGDIFWLSFEDIFWLSFEDIFWHSFEDSGWLSFGGSFWLSFGLFPLTILLHGTRLASWLLPFDGTRDPELSVSERTVQGRKPKG